MNERQDAGQEPHRRGRRLGTALRNRFGPLGALLLAACPLLLAGPNLSSANAALIQQGPKLTGSGETGAGWFGQDVAVSGDGSPALVSGTRDNNNKGAAWVFVRS